MNTGRHSQVVHLHAISLDVPAAEVNACRKLLSAEEIERADRFIAASNGNRWLVGRARLRQVLATYCKAAPESLRFQTQEFGKPILDTGADGLQLHFNLSHSHRLAVVAVSDIGSVGVDVEYERSLRDVSAVAARFFSPREQAQLADVDAARRQRAFFCCWTRKEAVIKATGEGLSARLDSFDVSLSPDAEAQVLADRRGDGSGDSWRIRHFEPQPGYVGAIAIRSARAIQLNYNADWMAEDTGPGSGTST